MAKTRIFISSTYYDLKQVRNDLEIFIKNMGYDPVLFERGNIPYGKDEDLASYCYKEIENTDIVICIIGGKYGSKSKKEGSITQEELKKAFEQGKQVYIFVERNVLTEYKTWSSNREIKGIKYSYVDDTKIYEFIETMYGLPNNNQIFAFENSREITEYLKEQWSGLFQRFLREESKKEEISLAKQLKEQINSLDTITKYLKEENKDNGKDLSEFVFLNNKLLLWLKSKLGISYNFYIKNLSDLKNLLSKEDYYFIRGRSRREPTKDYEYLVWRKTTIDRKIELKVTKSFFDPLTNELLSNVNEIFKEGITVEFKEEVTVVWKLEEEL